MGRPTQADSLKPAFVALFERGATVGEACAVLKVPETTYYEWHGGDAEFSGGVARAREAFAANTDAELQSAVTRSLVRYLLEGETVERETTKTTGDRTVTQRTVERRPCPKWVFDKLMPESVAGDLHQHVHLHGEGPPP